MKTAKISFGIKFKSNDGIDIDKLLPKLDKLNNY